MTGSPRTVARSSATAAAVEVGCVDGFALFGGHP